MKRLIVVAAKTAPIAEKLLEFFTPALAAGPGFSACEARHLHLKLKLYIGKEGLPMSAELPIADSKNGLGDQVQSIFASRNGSSRFQWWRRYGYALHLVGCFFLVMLATLSVDLINKGGSGTYYFIWVANGLLLSYLLLAPRWCWPAYLCTGAAAHLFAALLIWGTWDPAQFLYTTLDIGEVLAAALLLRRRSALLPRFTHRTYLLRFLGYAVVACPTVTGSIYMFFAVVCQHTRPVSAFLSWAAVNALGTAVVTPACVAIFQTRFRSTVNSGRYWLYLVLFVAAILAVFTQNSVTLLDFIYPILVLILLNMGLGWAALATLFVAVAGGWFSMRGIGPLAITSEPNPGYASVVRMQMLVASAMLMLYTISIVLEKQRSTERRLRNIVAQRNLVTENSRDVIILSDLDDHRSYVSPAAESLLGWMPEEMIKQGCTEMVHPDDLAAMQVSLRQLRPKPEESVAEYRFRKANGEYVWVEANLRMIRDPETGARSGILNMIETSTIASARNCNLKTLFMPCKRWR